MKVGVLGAGRIGLYIGGRLQLGGAQLTYYGRERLAKQIEQFNLNLIGFGNKTPVSIPWAKIHYQTNFADIEKQDIILVTLKTIQSKNVYQELSGTLSKNTIIVCLQNGVENSNFAKLFFPNHLVLDAMVTFNVVELGLGQFHQSTEGPFVIDQAIGDDFLSIARKQFPHFIKTQNITGFKWSKLLINLNNAINALAGIPLKTQLENRGYRKLFAQVIQEALPIIEKKGIQLEKITPLKMQWIPYLLSLPDWLFKKIAKKMIDIDPKAKQSMLLDIEQNRPTEVDDLNGLIVQEAKKLGLPAPLNQKITLLVKQMESKQAGSLKLSPQDIT
jgi:2-dehydropantoate 2-reductase